MCIRPGDSMGFLMGGGVFSAGFRDFPNIPQKPPRPVPVSRLRSLGGSSLGDVPTIPMATYPTYPSLGMILQVGSCLNKKHQKGCARKLGSMVSKWVIKL